MCSDHQHQAPKPGEATDDGHLSGPSAAGARLTASPAAPLAVAAVALLGCLFLVAADPTTPGGPVPTCPTKAIFGINCPGCGTSRMIYSLLHLDVVAAIQFNALGVVAVALLLWSWLAWLLTSFGKRIPVWSDHPKASRWVLGVVIVWTVLRLLPMEPFTSLQV